VQQRITYKICTIVRSCLNDSALTYFQETCKAVARGKVGWKACWKVAKSVGAGTNSESWWDRVPDSGNCDAVNLMNTVYSTGLKNVFVLIIQLDPRLYITKDRSRCNYFQLCCQSPALEL